MAGTSVTTIENLHFGYKRGEPIFEGLSWEFPTASTTVITGRSGRGKSTLLYLIGMLLSPWAGRISVAGVDVAPLSDSARSRMRAESVGFVFQDAALDSTRTVLDNVCEGALYARIPLRYARDRALELLDRFDVGLRVDHKPGEVSGGQAQRVALCRALLMEPDLILADEPTGNLDADSARVVLEALQGAAHQSAATVVIASHDPVVIDRADHVLAL